MVYLLYFATFFFVPLQYIFEPATVLIITATFFIVISLCMIYFNTDNSMGEAFKASLLATTILQLCCLLGQHELILSVNKPYHAIGLLVFIGTLFALHKCTQWGIQLASLIALVCLGSLWGVQFLIGHEMFEAVIASKV